MSIIDHQQLEMAPARVKSAEGEPLPVPWDAP